MSAYDYCRDKVALPGSPLYYSVLFVTPRLREALTALHAAAEEFREVAEEVSDEGVARAKLGWWAPEMQRAGAGLEQARRTVARSAHLRLRRALDEMPAADHAAQSSRRALAEMGLAQLRAMDRAGYAALERPVVATPLRKLWIAWKHRQR